MIWVMTCLMVFVQLFLFQARVAELVDALDLGSSSGDGMGVRFSPLALIY